MRLPFDHFDLIARWYDHLIGDREADAADRSDRLCAALAAEPDQWLVDVGGGTGRHSAPLARQGVRTVICDRSWGMLRQAASKGLAVVYASADRLPFAAGAADRLLVVDAFHHFTRPGNPAMQSQVAGDLVRVLKPGGRLVIHEPNIERPTTKLIAAGELLLLMGSRFWTPAQITTMFEAIGAHTLARDDRGIDTQLTLTR